VRAAVYTCITAGYDWLLEPRFVAPELDHVCFTDGVFESRVWQVRPLVRQAATASRTARYHKLMSHEVLPEYDVTLWLDATYRIDGDLSRLLAGWLEVASLALRKHPRRRPLCLYEEARACLKAKRGDPKSILLQVESYRKQECPGQLGLYTTGILARRNTPEVRRFNEAWWAEVERFSDRDQISFPYVLWKQKLELNAVVPPDFTDGHYPFLYQRNHRWTGSGPPPKRGVMSHG
jgi:hypothetical protein